MKTSSMYALYIYTHMYIYIHHPGDRTFRHLFGAFHLLWRDIFFTLSRPTEKVPQRSPVTGCGADKSSGGFFGKEIISFSD
jgi:hypothetical protein